MKNKTSFALCILILVFAGLSACGRGKTPETQAPGGQEPTATSPMTPGTTAQVGK